MDLSQTTRRMTQATERHVYAECLAQWELLRARPWRVTLPPHVRWEDLRQIVVTRAWFKIHLWSPRRGPRAKWIGRVMKMCLIGLLTPYRKRSS